ncbi:MAG: tRNA uridine-5-carboxymethylaminomethyl(34) synthesis GTPase MnmE [Bacilli bacterium]|nr:tRNA uridine-5-carboxymethylaminomethyl(34) synthesis GTPase MnmE [Bacilli bacterium]
MEDTIVAISTALGVGAISIVRVSGTDAISIVNSVFNGKNLEEVPTHTINYGKIVDNKDEIDEVLISIMRAPRTFTREDVVEINCHGGIMTTQKVLELLIRKGCRLAEPGEFTKRAFLNGRIDLTEAEGIMDLIDAKTENMRKMAMNKVNGRVSGMIKNLRDSLAQIISNIEVNIDYPEYDDIEEMTVDMIRDRVSNIENEISKILKESESGKILKEGIKTSIIGRPNVGKSSLLNLLLDEDKAIVTDIEGTTRDIVEGTLNLDGIVLNMIDTAGIRKTDNIVEQIGVNKSIDLIEKSDLILFVLNNNEEITEDEIKLYEQVKNKNHIIIINKIDLENKLKLPFDDENIIKMSTLNNTGLDDLKEIIKKLFKLENIETSDFTYITNSKDIAILKDCLDSINDIKESLKHDISIDMIEIDIKNIWNKLGEIIGLTYEDELIDYMFSHFCLGK